MTSKKNGHTCFVDTRRPADSLDTLKQKDDDEEGILILVKANNDLGVQFHKMVTFETILSDHCDIKWFQMKILELKKQSVF